MGAPPKELVDAIVNSLHRQDGWDSEFRSHAKSGVSLCCPDDPELLSVYVASGRRLIEFGGVRFIPGAGFAKWRRRICAARRIVYVPAEKRREVEAVRHAVSALNGGISA